MPEDPKRAAALKRVLDLAEVLDERSRATDGERDNAYRLGQRLIQRWGFTFAEVEAAGRAEAERRMPTYIREAREAARRAAARPPVPAGNQFGPFGAPTTTNGGTIFVRVVWG